MKKRELKELLQRLPPTALAPARGSARSSFFWGLLSGLALMMLAPLFGRQLRPLARKGIKGGVVLGKHLQTLAAEVREDLEDIAAEAKSELGDQKT
jgi:hypothetical protein